MLTVPSIMLRALQVSEDGGAVPEDCLERVLGDLRQAREPTPQDVGALRVSICGAFETLRAVRLLGKDTQGNYFLNDRGERVLRDHPKGVDASVLEVFPEYRAFLDRKGRDRGAVDEPKPQHFEGHAAFQAGKGLADNPYAFDSAAHLEWENGWGKASKRQFGTTPNQSPKGSGVGHAPPPPFRTARNR